jgi:hypothetical protein
MPTSSCCCCCCSGSAANGAATGNGGKKKKKNKGKGNSTAGGAATHKPLTALPQAKIFSLTSQQLWQTLQQLVHKRFGYDISLKGGAAISRNPSGTATAPFWSGRSVRALTRWCDLVLCFLAPSRGG